MTNVIIPLPATSGGGGVSSINTETGAITLTAGANISITDSPAGTFTIAATGELSATLTNTHIFVGNASNVATDVALSGDATIANTGVLTLATVNASPGSTTISSITTNAKGLVTANTSASTTGSGNVVLATSPTLVTPVLGTPTSGTLTNCTGLPVAGGGTGDASFTAYAPVVGGTTTTGALQSASTGISNSGYVLTSTGSSSLPTFQALPASGDPRIASFPVTPATAPTAAGTTATTQLAVGDGATVAGNSNGTLALGNSYASGLHAISIGIGDHSGSYGATVGDGIAIGYHALANGGDLAAIAIGQGAQATTDSVCIGYNAIDQGAGESVIIGRTAQNYSSGGYSNVVIGYSATGGGEGDNVAIGHAATAGTGLSQQSIAIGVQSNACITSNSNYCIAIGSHAKADGTTGGSIAIGSGAYAANDYSIVITPGGSNTRTANDTASHQLCIGDSRASVYINSIFLNQGATAVGTVQNTTVQLTPATGSNIAGSSLTITPGNGTGTGGSGSIIFQTAPVAASSSTANTLASVLTLNPDKTSSFLGNILPVTTNSINLGTASKLWNSAYINQLYLTSSSSSNNPGAIYFDASSTSVGQIFATNDGTTNALSIGSAANFVQSYGNIATTVLQNNVNSKSTTFYSHGWIQDAAAIVSGSGVTSDSGVYLGYTQGHVATTDATVTTVCRYFPLATLNNAHSGFLKIYVTGCRTGGSSGSTGDSVGAEITALVYQVYSGSVCTIVQQNTTLMKSNANCNVSITTSSQYLVVQVTGDTNNNYDWSCTIVHNTVG